MKDHSFATLFSEFAVILRPLFSDPLRPPLLNSSRTTSARLNFLQFFSTGSQLFHPSPSRLNSFHLFPSLLNSSQRFSPLPTLPSLFSTCLNSSHLLPPPQLFPPLLISPLSQLMSNLLTTSTLANSSQLSSSLLLPITEMLTHRASFYTEKLYSQQAFTHSKLSYREAFTHRSFEALFKRNLKRKIICAKIKKMLPNYHSHVSRCHHNPIYDSQLQNVIILHRQLPQRGTLTQPFHFDLQTLSCKTQKHNIIKEEKRPP